MLDQAINSIDKEDLKIILKNGVRSNTLFGVTYESIIYFKWWYVKVELPNLINEGKFTKIITYICNVTESQVNNANYKEMFSFVLWLLDEIKLVSELEENYLSSEPNSDLKSAGIEKLNELGEINTLDNLAGGDILKWKKIKKLPYHIVFDKLRKNNLDAEVQKRYNEIMIKKSKNGHS